MQSIVEFILANRYQAHWIILGTLLLAGCSLPISIDLVLIFTSFLAATLIPERTLLLYLSLLVGTYFSAWIAYGIGRFLGKKLLTWRFFAKMLPQKRLQRIHAFYQKHGFLTLLCGRFIPFGVRNCIFITTGMSRSPFCTFALRDLIACPLWVTICFTIFFSIGQNYTLLMQKMKMINIALFLVFGVTLISFVWYKKRKKKQAL